MKKEKYHQQRFYILKLICLADHLRKSKIIVVLILILVELQNLFFSTQMFVHLKQLFVHNFDDSFQVKKVAHLQYHNGIYAFNLNIRLQCQTLSNALDISKKTPPTSIVGFSSNAVCISCKIVVGQCKNLLEENLTEKVQKVYFLRNS